MALPETLRICILTRSVNGYGPGLFIGSRTEPRVCRFLRSSRACLNRRRSETAIYVTARKTTVRNGESFVLGHGGFGWALKYETVGPTTIEEYMILRYIREVLGQADMPPVQLPKVH